MKKCALNHLLQSICRIHVENHSLLLLISVKLYSHKGFIYCRACFVLCICLWSKMQHCKSSFSTFLSLSVVVNTEHFVILTYVLKWVIPYFFIYVWCSCCTSSLSSHTASKQNCIFSVVGPCSEISYLWHCACALRLIYAHLETVFFWDRERP